MKIVRCYSVKDWENQLYSISLIASSFYILVSTNSIRSPTFDHCSDEKVSANYGVMISLKVTIYFYDSRSRLVKDYLSSPSRKVDYPSSSLQKYRQFLELPTCSLFSRSLLISSYISPIRLFIYCSWRRKEGFAFLILRHQVTYCKQFSQFFQAIDHFAIVYRQSLASMLDLPSPWALSRQASCIFSKALSLSPVEQRQSEILKTASPLKIVALSDASLDDLFESTNSNAQLKHLSALRQQVFLAYHSPMLKQAYACSHIPSILSMIRMKLAYIFSLTLSKFIDQLRSKTAISVLLQLSTNSGVSESGQFSTSLLRQMSDYLSSFCMRESWQQRASNMRSRSSSCLIMKLFVINPNSQSRVQESPVRQCSETLLENAESYCAYLTSYLFSSGGELDSLAARYLVSTIFRSSRRSLKRERKVLASYSLLFAVLQPDFTTDWPQMRNQSSFCSACSCLPSQEYLWVICQWTYWWEGEQQKILKQREQHLSVSC